MSTYPIFSNTQNNRRKTFINKDTKRESYIFTVYISQILEFRDFIEDAKDIFSQEQIYPDQCEYLIHKINSFRKTGNSITAFIKKQADTHYSLLVSTYYFSDQIDIFTDSIREYQGSSDQRSTKKSMQKILLASLRNLESSIQDLLKELDKTTSKAISI